MGINGELDKLDRAYDQAKLFIYSVERLRSEPERGDGYFIRNRGKFGNGSPESAEVRRRSMDLTRALAKLRKPE